jgi:nitrogen fixation NifU-like protein
MSDLYHQQLLEEAENPRNQTDIDHPDAEAKSINSSCGDTLVVKVKYSSDGQTISDVSWNSSGCIISRAGMSVLSDLIKGKSKDEVAQITPQSVLDELSLEQISPGRVKCLTLGLSAIKQL